MSQELQFVLTPREPPTVPTRKRIEQMRELWLTLAKRAWTSLAVIPVDATSSTQDLAFSLADAGTELSDLPVSAITTNFLDPGSARALATLTQQVNERERGRAAEEEEARKENGEAKDRGGLPALPRGKLIVSVPAVTGEPVAIAVADAVDLVVLAIQVGKAKVRDVRRTIDRIGRHRIAGCILY